ncbi:hypothetical protein HZA55_05110 [Candidatus Poribacteria bacterium]|nr:hypothetical protein [Candidatus Poribacteria bacterium]
MIQYFFENNGDKKKPIVYNKSKNNDSNEMSSSNGIKPLSRRSPIKLIEQNKNPKYELSRVRNNSVNKSKNDYIQEDNKIIFNEFSEADYGSLDLKDLNEKYANFDKPNEKILSDIEWAIDKLRLEDMMVHSDEQQLK